MKLLKIFLISFVLFAFNPVFAQEQGTGVSNSTEQGTGVSNTSSSVNLQNPLGSVDSIPTLVQKILDVVLTIGVPIIVIAIIYSGFKFIAAQGNPEKLKEAKQTLLYVLIGAAILLAAYAIAQAIVSTVTAIRG